MNNQHRCVFVIDDDPLLLHTLGGIAASVGLSIEVFQGEEPLISRLSERDRGLLILGDCLQCQCGRRLIETLRSRGIFLPFLIVSDRPDVRAAVAAMKLGALDVLVKPADPGELEHAIKDALCRDDEAAAEREVQELARAKWASLSSREQSVCRLVAQGLLNKQVAAELGVNIPTAHSYRVSAFKKLRVDSASALYRFLYLIKEAV